MVSGQIAKNYATNFLYAPHGGLPQYLFGNNVARGMSYDNRLRIDNLWDTISFDPNRYLFVEQPAWNANGNLGSVISQGGGPGLLSSVPVFKSTFAYDNVNRLTSVSDTGGASQTYSYDAFGNAQLPTNAFSANNSNRLAGVSYDAAGNQLVVNGNTLTYDAESRVTSATNPPAYGGGTEAMAYNALGQRVQKVLNGATTVYVHDGMGKLIAEYGSTTEAPCTTCYLSVDHLGSTRS